MSNVIHWKRCSIMGGAGDVKGSPLEGVLELFESDVVRGFIRDDTPC
jgi:hypothetical protein